MTPKELQTKDFIINLLDKAYVNRTHDLPNSIAVANQALELSESISNKPLIGKCLNMLSLFHMIISDYDTSNNFSKRAISCFKEIGDDRGIADAKYNIGSVLYKSDDYHGGLLYLLEAFVIYKENNDFANKAKVEKAIGTIYEYIGDEENAFKTYMSAIRSARKIGNTNLESNVLNNLSGLVLKRNKTTTAMRMITRSLTLKKQTNDIRGYGFALYGRGKVYLKTKDYNKAEKDFLQALKIHEETVENLGKSMSLRKLALVYYERKDYKKAETTILQCLNFVEKHSIFMGKTKTYHLLYLIYKGFENSVESLKYLELYLKENEAIMKLQTLKVIENYQLINQMNVLEHEAKIREEKQNAIDKRNAEDELALRQKQEFLSIMSHEIRTPLNAITTIVTLLNEQVKDKDKELFDSLQFSSNNLIAIVNDILDFTKLDSNKATLDLNSTNFDRFCVNVHNLHINQAKSKGLELILTNNVPKRNYLLDQTKVSQILDNLIGNAIKFTEKGRVTLKTSLQKETPTHDHIRFSIIDEGEGISERHIDEIFDSFTQVKPITTRKQGGTGLGLAIVKKLVTLHGGNIQVKSVLGEGSEFYFTIELEKSNAIKNSKNLDYSILKNKKVLVAEDNSINAMLMKKILSKFDIETIHVTNGRKAVETAKLDVYDFILMDIHMPEMNGFDATKLIKTEESSLNNDTPIFAVTADVLTNHNKEATNYFDAILWKPLEIDKLFKALKTVSQTIVKV